MTVTTPLTQPGNVEVVPTIAITATIPTPVEEPTAPVEEEPTTPVEEEPTTPVEEEPAPVEEEPTTPVEEEPASVEEEPASVEEEPAPVEEEPAPVEEEPAPQVYVVQPGDTLRSIAEQLGVDIMDLLQVNGMTIEDADSIYPGQELVVP
jgi:LysM repeat protein